MIGKATPDRASITKLVKRNPPIFVVGAPRSGTTLLAAMLSAHSQLSCGPETRFFHFLANIARNSLFESWPENAVDYLFSVKLVDEPVPEHYDLTREQIFTYLEGQQPSIPAVLSALTEQYMHRIGKSRWVEKSPEHLKCVNDIRKYYPNSPIIRIIRDPRDVALSLQKVPWAPQDFLENLMFWRDYDNQSAAFFQGDENSKTVYYENLIQTPKDELKELCAFIGEGFEHQMLDTSGSASNVVATKEVWHRIVHKPVDKTRIQVWKREISKGQNRIAEALIGDRLSRYGYKRVEEFDRGAVVYPSLNSLLQHRKTLGSFVDSGIRFWQATGNDESEIKIYVGEPDTDKWLRHKKPERWWDTLRIMAEILKWKIARKRTFWVRDSVAVSGSGYCSRAIEYVFQFAGKSQLVGD